MVLSKRVHELKVDQRILVYSYKGNRSTTACEYLASKGFKHIYNMLGGIDLWTEEGYEVVR
jgi:rhodanese-related sulfurtransferase